MQSNQVNVLWSFFPTDITAVLGDVNTPLYWLNATLFGGPPIPEIEMDSLAITSGSEGDSASINFKMNIQRRSNCWRLFGLCVRRPDWIILEHDWDITIVGGFLWGNTPIIPAKHSDAALYCGDDKERGGFYYSGLSNQFEFLAYTIGMGDYLLNYRGPIAIIIWRRLRAFSRAESILGTELDPHVRKKFFLDLGLVACNGVFIALAILLPWAYLGNECVLTGTHVLNEYGLSLGYNGVFTLIMLLAIGFIIAFWVPLLGMLFDLLLPGLFVLIWSAVAGFGGLLGPLFGPPAMGPAFYIMLAGVILLFVVGIFRIKYTRSVKRALKLKVER